MYDTRIYFKSKTCLQSFVDFVEKSIPRSKRVENLS